jgi:cytochrome c biogenesis protein ResB
MTPQTLARKITTLLGSLRLTIVLLSALGAIFLLGLWIPQKGIIDYESYLAWKAGNPSLVSIIEYLGFMEIYKAPVTLAIWAVFFINLSLVMWHRIPVIRRRVAVPSPLPEASSCGFPHAAVIRLAGSPDFEGLRVILQKGRYQVYGSRERFYAVRNRRSPLASLLFHLSFFLILCGGVVSIYTRFVGQVDLAEGESFQGEPSRYSAPPLMPRFGGYPDVRIAIRKVRPMIEAVTATGLQVELEDGPQSTRTININQPYRRGTVSFVIKGLGLAPLVILRDSSGRELDGAFVKLNVMKGREDRFRMGATEFTVRFFPDHEIVGGEDTTRSEEFRNPVLLIMAQEGGSRTVHRIPCQPGARLQIGGMTYEFAKFSYWVRFTVVSEKGVPLVYAGFLMACLGLFWRLVLYKRELAGTVQATGDGTSELRLAFRSEYYRSLGEEEFEELQRALNALSPPV